MENEDNGAPKYVVLEKSLIGNRMYEAGETAEYDGLPAENLQPTCDVGRARYQEYLKSNAERVATMKDQFSDSAVGDPAAFAAAFAKELASQKAEADAKFAALQEQNTKALTLIAQLVEKLSPTDAPATPPTAPATDTATKPAGKAKADKADAKADGEGLV